MLEVETLLVVTTEALFYELQETEMIASILFFLDLIITSRAGLILFKDPIYIQCLRTDMG